jgi:hypothetical protein
LSDQMRLTTRGLGDSVSANSIYVATVADKTHPERRKL